MCNNFYIYIYIYVCMYVCMYVEYIYIYIYIYIIIIIIIILRNNNEKHDPNMQTTKKKIKQLWLSKCFVTYSVK